MDFTGITSPSSTHIATYDNDDEDKEDSPLIGTEFSTAMYSAISTSDDFYAVTRSIKVHDYAQQIFRFKVDMPVSEFSVAWEGNIAFYYRVPPHICGMDIWNSTAQGWESIKSPITPTGELFRSPLPPLPPPAGTIGREIWMVADQTISKAYSTNVSDYIDDDGYISVMVSGKNSYYATICTDYIKLDYTIAVPIDIEPPSCPNPLNPKSRGVLPVAVLGTEDFDVTQIDPATVVLSRQGVVDVVPALRWAYEDVATPFEGELCDCHTLGADGYLDLTLKFSIPELVETLRLNEVAGGTLPLTLIGNLRPEFGGEPFLGEDCIWVLNERGPRK